MLISLTCILYNSFPSIPLLSPVVRIREIMDHVYYSVHSTQGCVCQIVTDFQNWCFRNNCYRRKKAQNWTPVQRFQFFGHATQFDRRNTKRYETLCWNQNKICSKLKAKWWNFLYFQLLENQNNPSINFYHRNQLFLILFIG